MAEPERGVAAWVVRRRWWVAALWALVFAPLVPAATRVERVLDVRARVDGSESAAVDAIRRARVPTPFAQHAVLVVTGVPSVGTPQGDAVLDRIVGAVRRVPGVTATLSYGDANAAVFAPADGAGTFVLVGLAGAPAEVERTLERLRAASRSDEARLRRVHARAALRWTGEAALNADLRRTSAADAQGAEQRALPLTLALLVVAFGAVAAALLPIAAAMVAITVALGLAALAGAHWPLSILLQNVVTMLGLGLGIDYALLMVTRFREERAAGHDAEAAAVHALRNAGHTILISAVAVLIGFVGLLLIPLNELRAVAVGGALAVVTAALVAVTLLPGVLAACGARIELGRVWRRRAGPDAAIGAASERWRRWGRWVTHHPARVLGTTAVPLLLLAAQAGRMRTTLPRVDWLPPRMESARALADLAAMDRAGVVNALHVIVELPPGTSALEPAGWNAVARVGRALAADARIARVQSLPVLVPLARPTPEAVAFIPPELRRGFVSRDQRVAVIEALPVSRADVPTLTRLVREIRARDAVALTGVPGARVLVGGLPAFNADYEDAIGGQIGAVVALVLGGTFVVLCLGFRSVVVPAKAILLNLLSVTAALGAVVLVFQDGHGGAWLGAPPAMGSLFPALPALVFCLVFGLSMDYDVFLVARVAEARRAGLDDREALAEGLARTGGVITSAATIMVVVFGAFMLGDFLMMKVLGFALAVAVLLDATVVRMAIGPALLALAGRWNWWPGWTPRRSPDGAGIAPSAPEPAPLPRGPEPRGPHEVGEFAA